MQTATPPQTISRRLQRQLARPQPTLSQEQCQALNAKTRPGVTCAVLHAPAKLPGGRKPLPEVIAVELPRSGQGKAPRRSVHIPPPSFAPPRFPRVSKHARQKHREGKFGSKGKATLAAKLMLLFLGWLYTIETMLARQTRRQSQREARG